MEPIKIIIPKEEYDYKTETSSSLTCVWLNDYEFYIDEEGKEIWKEWKYDYVSRKTKHYLLKVWKDDVEFFIDRNGEEYFKDRNFVESSDFDNATCSFQNNDSENSEEIKKVKNFLKDPTCLVTLQSWNKEIMNIKWEYLSSIMKYKGIYEGDLW